MLGPNSCAILISVMGSVMGLFPLPNGIIIKTNKVNPVGNVKKSWLDTVGQKYSRLRCLLHVKGFIWADLAVHF